jgi:hypothetical protein
MDSTCATFDTTLMCQNPNTNYVKTFEVLKYLKYLKYWYLWNKIGLMTLE